MSSVHSRRCSICHRLNAPCLLRRLVETGQATFSCSVCHHQFGSSSFNGHNHMRDKHKELKACVLDVDTGIFTHRVPRPARLPTTATPPPQPLKTKKKRKRADTAAATPSRSPQSPLSPSSTLSVASLPSLASSSSSTQSPPSIFLSPVSCSSRSDDGELSTIDSLVTSDETADNNDRPYDFLDNDRIRTPLLDDEVEHASYSECVKFSEEVWSAQSD